MKLSCSLKTDVYTEHWMWWIVERKPQIWFLVVEAEHICVISNSISLSLPPRWRSALCFKAAKLWSNMAKKKSLWKVSQATSEERERTENICRGLMWRSLTQPLERQPKRPIDTIQMVPWWFLMKSTIHSEWKSMINLNKRLFTQQKPSFVDDNRVMI